MHNHLPGSNYKSRRSLRLTREYTKCVYTLRQRADFKHVSMTLTRKRVNILLPISLASYVSASVITLVINVSGGWILLLLHANMTRVSLGAYTSKCLHL